MNVADRKADEAKYYEIGEKIGKPIGHALGKYGPLFFIVYVAAKRGAKAAMR